ncbi:MAG TPA: M4 family metallopeptidase [Edaphocola sp.]|nr:M4 family metallopeptidase [Edaphocola sp.]
MIKKALTTSILAMSFCTIQNLKAQEYRPNYLKPENEFILQNFVVIDSAGWFETKPESDLTFQNFNDIKFNFGMGEEDSFVISRETYDDYPFMEEHKKMTHTRYSQHYKGLRVEYAEIIIHHRNEKIEFINGKLAEGLKIDETPGVSEQDALNAAINYLGGEDNIYSWQDSAYEESHKEWKNNPDAKSYPTGELLFAKINNNQDYTSEQFKLAWKFTITSLSPEFTHEILIDAQSGAIIRDIDVVNYGHGDLSYNYGTNVYLDTRWRGGLYQHYVMRSDDANAPKIWTKKHHSTGAFGGYNCTWPYNISGCTTNAFDSDDEWDDEVVTTPHWLGTQAWNYWKEKFNRESFDNKGTEVRILNNMPTKVSSYNPSDDVLRFGRLNGAYGGPHQATRDIFGHEFGHAVIRYTVSNGHFNGFYESGALGESFADIFGYELERYINGSHLNWTLGEDTEIRRRMNNPELSVIYGPNEGCNDHNKSQPAFYHGPRWYYGNCDHGGVHINSGVQNYWFYLLTEGSTNAPEGTWNNVNVNGIGADKARDIVFYNMDNVLMANSDYKDSRIGSILAAHILYGGCSNEKIQTINAWAAVNIGTEYKPLQLNGPSSIFIYNGTPMANMPIQWVANGGNNRRYTWTTIGNWTWNKLTTPAIPFKFDNTFSVSNFNGNYNGIISVNDGCNTVSKTINFMHVSIAQEILISPNPVSNQMNVSVNFREANVTDPINIWLHGIDGQIYFTGQFNENTFSISASNLLPGNYYLTAQQSGIQKSVSFNKQ